MSKSRVYELDHLGSGEFQNLAAALALRVLGPGLSVFGEGADAGRDGYFEGEATYPSNAEHWRGVWYIQSKFHSPGLTNDAQSWLRKQVKAELRKFTEGTSKRIWPDNWIIATNVDPSGAADGGTFDKIRTMAKETQTAINVDIWGKKKIIQLLDLYPDTARRYVHLLTPGHVIDKLLTAVRTMGASEATILRHLIVEHFDRDYPTRLDEAGARGDAPPPIHRVFVNIPFTMRKSTEPRQICTPLAAAVSENHTTNDQGDLDRQRSPSSARLWFIKAGPGQGKSTIGQMVAQAHRASIILNDVTPAPAELRKQAEHVRASAKTLDLWPSAPRIPLAMELREYAHWLSRPENEQQQGLASYLAHRLSSETEEKVAVSAVRDLVSNRRTLLIFDGLDEVPTEDKDRVAAEIRKFLFHSVGRADTFCICTSRPQGYSGQFDKLPGIAEILLAPLPTESATECAQKLLHARLHRSKALPALSRLKRALEASPAVADLMKTPLQVHIMCIIVGSGLRPPERRWMLFDRFFEVILQREASRQLADHEVAHVLEAEQRLLRDIHARLGFVLHSRAETSSGASSELGEQGFRQLIGAAVRAEKDNDIERLTDVVFRAAKERLVLISTPTAQGAYAFDVRQLQEFFAGEYLYAGVDQKALAKRLELVVGDQHWREVLHFVVSAFIEQNRRIDLDVAVGVIKAHDSGVDVATCRLTRALAEGAQAVARLVAGGLLDDSRRDRALLQDLLKPLYDAPSAGISELVNAARRPWLQLQLLEEAARLNEASSQRIATALWESVGDDSPHATDVEAFFKDRTPPVFRFFSPDEPKWHSRARQHWLSLGDVELSRLGWYASRVGWATLLGRKRSDPLVSAIKEFCDTTTTYVLRFGEVSVARIVPATIANDVAKTLCTELNSLPSGRVGEVLRLILEAFCKSSVEPLRELLTRMGASWNWTSCLGMGAWLRVGLDPYSTRALGRSPVDVASALDDAPAPRSTLVVAYGEPHEPSVPDVTADLFESILEEAPNAAIRAWWCAFSNNESSQDINEIAGQFIANHPESAQWVPVAALKVVPTDRLLEVCRTLSVSFNWRASFEFPMTDVGHLHWPRWRLSQPYPGALSRVCSDLLGCSVLGAGVRDVARAVEQVFDVGAIPSLWTSDDPVLVGCAALLSLLRDPATVDEVCTITRSDAERCAHGSARVM